MDRIYIFKTFTLERNPPTIIKQQQQKYLLAHYQNNQTEVVIYSDDPVQTMKTRGGWIISTTKVQPLAEKSNPYTNKLNINSYYQPEGYICLASLLFLYKYCTFYGIISSKASYYCNNISLVANLTKYQSTQKIPTKKLTKIYYAQ